MRGGNVKGLNDRKRNQFFLIVAGLFLLIGYNNCKGTSDGALELSPSTSDPSASTTPIDGISGTLCEQQIKRLYSRSWFAFNRSNCATCHASGPGKGRFANPDINAAYDDFMAIGFDKVAKNAVSPTHNPPYTGSQHLQDTNTMKVEWLKGLEEFATCSGDAGAVPQVPPYERISMYTTEKTITLSADNTDMVLTWDINNDIKRINAPTEKLNLSNPGTFSIRVGRYKESGGATFYTVFSPTVSRNQKEINFEGIFVRINGILATYQTTFSFLNTNVDDAADRIRAGGTENAIISTGSIVIPKVVAPGDRIQISFIEIKDGQTIVPPVPNPLNIVARRDSNNVPIISETLIRKVDTQAPVQLNAKGEEYLAKDQYEVEFEITLERNPIEPVTFSISEVNELCSATFNLNNDNLMGTMRRIDNSSNCAANQAPQIYASICNGRGDATCTGAGTINEFTFGRSRNELGATYHRFDWDHMVPNKNFTIQPSERSKVVKLLFSRNRRAFIDDISEEPNRLLTLKIESVTGEGSVGTNRLAHFIVNKYQNPKPSANEPTYKELMASQFGPFRENCIRCHNSADKRGGYDITNYGLMMNNSVIIPGNPTASKMYYRMTLPAQNALRMPADGAMATDRIDVVKQWIKFGAKNN